MADFFSNKKVAKAYEPVFAADKRITIPGKYSGKLSDITPEVAAQLIAMGDNQIRPKKAAAAADAGSDTVTPEA